MADVESYLCQAALGKYDMGDGNFFVKYFTEKLSVCKDRGIEKVMCSSVKCSKSEDLYYEAKLLILIADP